MKVQKNIVILFICSIVLNLGHADNLDELLFELKQIDKNNSLEFEEVTEEQLLDLFDINETEVNKTKQRNEETKQRNEETKQRNERTEAYERGIKAFDDLNKASEKLGK